MPKISALPDAGTIDGTEVLPIVQGGSTVQVSINDIMAASSSTGTSVTFTRDTVHGLPSTPLTGDISASYTDAKPGCTVAIFHNWDVEPVIPVEWILMDGEYVTEELNIISAFHAGNGEVLYSIKQLA